MGRLAADMELPDKPLNTIDPNHAGPRGWIYDQLIDESWLGDLIGGRITQAEAARRIGVTQPEISRVLPVILADLAAEDAQTGWEGPSIEVNEVLDDFARFRARYMRTPQGNPYLTPDFQVRWIDAMVEAATTGGQLMILSPPRHGKTDLVDHFCVWEICRNPHIQILRIGGNQEVAENSVRAVADHLEANIDLIAETLGPGRTFKPRRAGRSWNASAFTVATRTIPGIKSPTMTAVGRGGKIINRDLDLIVGDDIEDHTSTLQPKARADTRSWVVTQFGSRKQAHTAVMLIGSRQHYDDLYGHLLLSNAWQSIVEEAHDSTCLEDPADYTLHTDCMLFQEVNGYEWLMERRESALTVGGLGLWEMVYLNRPQVDGMTLFSREALFAARNLQRGIGDIPEGCILVAGLDPAATGYQAGFLWAFHPDTGISYMVDIEATMGGGVQRAHELMGRWHDRYGLTHWVIEENGFQRAIRQDRYIRDWATANDIYLEGHITDAQNKWDPRFGVGSLAHRFDQGLIDLPYMGTEAVNKTDLYHRQLMLFGADQTVKRGTSDIAMASWFPVKVFRRLTRERQASMNVTYDASFTGFGTTPWGEAPWS